MERYSSLTIQAILDRHFQESAEQPPFLDHYEVKKTGQYEHTVIFSYSDGSKKSFDGKNWKFCEDVYDNFH